MPEVSLAAVTPGRKYLLGFAHEDFGTGCFWEAATGKACGRLMKANLPQKFHPTLCAFDADGGQVAVYGSDWLVVWNLKDGTVRCEPLPVKSDNTLAFCAADLLLLDKALLGLRQRKFVWNYSAPDPVNGWEKVWGSPDGRPWAIVGTPQASRNTTYLMPVNSPSKAEREHLIQLHAGEVVRPQTYELSAESLLDGKVTLEKTVGPTAQSDESENALRTYVGKVLCELIVGDDAPLKESMRWFAHLRRPCAGVRWGIAPQTIRTAPPELLEGMRNVGLALVQGLEDRNDSGAYGDWPRLGDARLRQVVVFTENKPVKELLAAAKRRAVNVLLVVSLTAKPAAKSVEYLLAVSLFDVSSGDKLWTSDAWSSSRVAELLASRVDTVAKFTGEILQHIDADFSLSPMPALTPEAAGKRLKSLADSPSKAEDGLRMLLEAHYYQAQGLLAADEATSFYNSLLGTTEGRSMAAGNESARRQLLQNSPLWGTWLDAAKKPAK